MFFGFCWLVVVDLVVVVVLVVYVVAACRYGYCFWLLLCLLCLLLCDVYSALCGQWRQKRCRVKESRNFTVATW